MLLLAVTMGAVQFHLLADSICLCDSVRVDRTRAKPDMNNNRGCLGNGAFLFLGKGTGHATTAGTPADTT